MVHGSYVSIFSLVSYHFSHVYNWNLAECILGVEKMSTRLIGVRDKWVETESTK